MSRYLDPKAELQAAPEIQEALTLYVKSHSTEFNNNISTNSMKH